MQVLLFIFLFQREVLINYDPSHEDRDEKVKHTVTHQPVLYTEHERQEATSN
jgi:hypothetical protein